MTETDDRFDRRSHREDAAAWSKSSRTGVVACAHYLAAQVGGEVLAAGGGAADAAVAAALALNVTEPAASGLGGMAMATVHGPDLPEPVCLQGPCLAPAAATPELVGQAHRYRGYRAIAVPGAPALWSALHRRFGRLPLGEVVRPVVALARHGYPITALQHELATTYRKALRGGNAAATWLDADGRPKPAGTVIVQAKLADTIERLGRDGFMDFYRGGVASEIRADMEANDGFIAAADLEAVTEPEPVEAIKTRCVDAVMFTAGPPAGGLALAQLAAMNRALGRTMDLREPDDLVLLVEMIRRVRRDRVKYRLDVGARSLDGAAELLTDDFAGRSLRQVRSRVADAGETSHLSAMDDSGLTIAMTCSIERSFGSGCMNSRLGFLYNGYLRGFKIQNKRHPHYLVPGAPARSNAAPTIQISDDGAVTAVGSTGSERMVSGIFATLQRLPFEGPFGAVAAPRVHCTPDGEVLVELARLSEACRAALTGRYKITELEPWAFKFGGLQLARREGGEMIGVGEPRRDGDAGVPDLD